MRSRSAIAAAVTAGALGLAPGLAAGATRTISLLAQAKTCNVNAGVSSKCIENLSTSAGKRAGTATWQCAFNPPGSANEVCTDTYKLKGGSIVVHFKSTKGVLGTHAITSGTGSFAGARGTVTKAP